ncbi:MAG: hypothetical protein A2V93_00285 [Ignavibacteria bacterium RBG_16_34_14]|nr:MAG: hypothetical protein A2V93_00285 [Ignavibacteria bacterium RBG_16_34_14]
MKQLSYIIVLLFVLTANNSFAQHHGGSMGNNGNGKDPAIAALLSIQPLPFAIGNFYTGNWERGILYTTAELALFIPAAILLGRNYWGFGMHNYSSYNYSGNRTSWTNQERTQFYYLIAGYIIVKIISAFDAGLSAEIYKQNLSVEYDAQTNSTMLTLNIPVR